MTMAFSLASSKFEFDFLHIFLIKEQKLSAKALVPEKKNSMKKYNTFDVQINSNPKFEILKEFTWKS